MTRFGSEPTEYSRKAKNGTEILPSDKIKCISWEKDICEWLTALLIQLNEPIKLMVMQYIDAIHFIANRKDAIYYSYDEKQHDKFYDCHSTYPGLNYVVKKQTFKKAAYRCDFG